MRNWTIYNLAPVQVGGLDIRGVIALAWSPKGTIMQTFERPDREKGNQHKNLKVGAWQGIRGALKVASKF